MLIQKGYRFQLRRLREAQERELVRWIGCARKVYNLALEWEKNYYKNTGKYPGRALMDKQIPVFKQEHPYLNDPYSQILQQVVADLHFGFLRSFKGLGELPDFKKKYEHDAIRIPQNFEVDAVNGRVFIPKLATQCSTGKKCEKFGWLRFRKSREIAGKPKNITIARENGKWYVSIQTEIDVPAPVHLNAGCEAGIDMGVVHAITLSDGTHLDLPVETIKEWERKLAHEQRTLARRVKFSKNWIQTKRKIQRINKHIANIRKDCLHKHSTTIAKNHGFVSMEDLRVKNMTRSAKGTVDAPGKNVKAKSGLNRAILRVGWGMFRTMLTYKQAWGGGKLILVPPQNTSRTCPMCGHVSAENRKTQACFHCVKCGHEANADVVGAINVLKRGRTLSLCGGMSETKPKRLGGRAFRRSRNPPKLSDAALLHQKQ